MGQKEIDCEVLKSRSRTRTRSRHPFTSDARPLFIMFYMFASYLANAARRYTLINEFIGNSSDVGLGPRQPGGQSSERFKTTRSVTPRHFNFAKKLSNY